VAILGPRHEAGRDRRQPVVLAGVFPNHVDLAMHDVKAAIPKRAETGGVPRLVEGSCIPELGAPEQASVTGRRVKPAQHAAGIQVVISHNGLRRRRIGERCDKHAGLSFQ